jgi:hypothetical protein
VQKIPTAPKEAPNQEVQLSDFKMNMTADADHINIITTYQNQPIHTFSLSQQELVVWMHATSQQKYTFTQSKVNPTVFGNDLRLIQIIITSYIQRIDAILIQYFTNWIEKSFSFIPISKYFSVKCLKS